MKQQHAKLADSSIDNLVNGVSSSIVKEPVMIDATDVHAGDVESKAASKHTSSDLYSGYPPSNFWNSYIMRLFPGWPDHQTLADYGFSLFLVFLLAFTAEFCSLYPIQKHIDSKVALLNHAGMRALKMFMSYLAVVAVITTDFVFFLAAVAGHGVGNFVGKMYQYQIEEAMAALQSEDSFEVTKV
ncbi:unnamed protein product [Fraxinus pennsylvanica]|uniref:Copper transporter n=1 Tax=Fraxinus pennsylvanica TaxID=56036 RepID=A0AAD1Z7Q5_9LAMI|nr:unnamed protein product [Fraxinus pennsylvanica]